MKEISYTSQICFLPFTGQEETPRFTLAETSREHRTQREENDSKRTQLGSPNGSPQQLFGKQDRLSERAPALSAVKLKKGPPGHVREDAGRELWSWHGRTTEKVKSKDPGRNSREVTI